MPRGQWWGDSGWGDSAWQSWNAVASSASASPTLPAPHAETAVAASPTPPAEEAQDPQPPPPQDRNRGSNMQQSQRWHVQSWWIDQSWRDNSDWQSGHSRRPTLPAQEASPTLPAQTAVAALLTPIAEEASANSSRTPSLSPRETAVAATLPPGRTPSQPPPTRPSYQPSKPYVQSSASSQDARVACVTHDAGDNAVDAAAAAATPETPVLGLSFQQVSDVTTECSIEMHNVALKWARQDYEAKGFFQQVLYLKGDTGSTVLIPPIIQPAKPAPPEAFEFLTEAPKDRWKQWSPIWMLSNLRDADRELVVWGPQLR